nr:MAG TPA: hypothetical protein [Caudoviricetes sp.]
MYESERIRLYLSHIVSYLGSSRFPIQNYTEIGTLLG